MAARLPISPHPDAETIRARVLRAIAANRTPGLHFAGHFLDIQWRSVTGEAIDGTLEIGPHCGNADGTMNLMPLGLLADFALAASGRSEIPHGARLGTVHLHLQFTGVPAAGDVEAETVLLGYSEGAKLRTSLSSGTLRARGRTIAHIQGEFVLLDPPQGVTMSPLPWERTEPPSVVPVAVDRLEPDEAAILQTCEAALAKASPQAPFIERLWGGEPHRNAQGAVNRLAIGPHIGNRVGHVQGGLLLALAATTACAAVPASMMLSAISAWYLRPAQGKGLGIRSRILHAGRTVSVVRTEIRADGERVLEAVSHHAARRR